MGASPTPMAFGEVYTSLQTGVIDGYEHDASTTLQQRFYEVAHVMTRTRHIAGVLGLWGSTVTLERLPADLRAIARAGGARRGGAISAGRSGARRRPPPPSSPEQGMTIREFDNSPFRPRAERSGTRKAARSA